MMGSMDYSNPVSDYSQMQPPMPPLPPMPPPVTPVAGFISSPVSGLEQSGHLILGPGARRDTAGALGAPLIKLSSDQQNAIQRAKKYAMEQSIKMVLMQQTMSHQQNQTKSLQKQQAVTVMCKIYVGCINYDTREDAIKQAFIPFGPIRSISMSWDPLTQKHKGFAFVEYEKPEAAQLALEQMNGILISGRNIKVGRPSQMPQAQACIDEITKEARNFNRIYIASIHKDLSEDDIKSVFSAFGPIKTCELAQSAVPGRHKGFAYMEYETPQATQDAISSMNLFDLGGQYLRVGRAITPPDTLNTGISNSGPAAMPTAAAVAAAAATAKIQAMDAVAEVTGIDAASLAKTHDQKNARKPPIPYGGRDDSRPGDRERKSHGRGESSESGRESGSRYGGGDSRNSQGRDVARSHSEPQSQPPLPPAPLPPMPAPPAAAVPPPNFAPPSNFSQPPSNYPAPPNFAPPGLIGISTSQAGNMEATPINNKQDAYQNAQKAATQAHQLELQKKLMEGGSEAITLSQQENMQIKGQSARHLVMQKLMGARNPNDSTVLVLKNMVGPENVDEDLQEEINEECSKYGKVENVIIYQERQSEDEEAEILVKIFVEFAAPDHVKAAKNSLNGRFFGGRTVRAEVYDQDLYNHQDLSG